MKGWDLSLLPFPISIFHPLVGGHLGVVPIPISNFYFLFSILWQLRPQLAGGEVVKSADAAAAGPKPDERSHRPRRAAGY